MSGPRLSIIPARAATDRALKPRDLQVLCVLGRHTNDYGWCRRSQVKMAEEMGCARSTVYEAVERLIAAGYLERHEQSDPTGRDSAHVYRVVLDPVHPNVGAIEELREDTPPAGISAPPAGPEPAPPAGPGPAPINDSPLTTPPNDGERARAGEDEGQAASAEEQAAGDTPGRAAFAKRVTRFLTGRGYLAGAWKNWDSGAALSWIEKQFAGLTPEERAEAERWRDAYLFDVADRKRDPVAPGNWLSGRTWQLLDPAILARAEKMRQAQLAPEERARPDGWAALAGPIGMAWLFGELAKGQPGGTVQPGVLWLDARLRNEWPSVYGWNMRLQQAGGAVIAERWHALKGAMEAVPVGTDVHAQWRACFAERGWPWLAAFDAGKVLWAPKGGPPGLAAFAELVRSGGTVREARDDGGGRQAAE